MLVLYMYASFISFTTASCPSMFPSPFLPPMQILDLLRLSPEPTSPVQRRAEGPTLEWIQTASQRLFVEPFAY
jgi:hypothetical protein